MNSKGIGEQIAFYRNEKNMTQQELADKVFVARSVVAHWEKGDHMPNVVTFAKICEVFEVSADTFLAEAEKRSNVAAKKNYKALLFVLLCLTLLVVLLCVALAVAKDRKYGEVSKSTPNPKTGEITDIVKMSMDDLNNQMRDDILQNSLALRDYVDKSENDIGLFLLTVNSEMRQSLSSAYDGILAITRDGSGITLKFDENDFERVIDGTDLYRIKSEKFEKLKVDVYKDGTMIDTVYLNVKVETVSIGDSKITVPKIIGFESSKVGIVYKTLNLYDWKQEF